MLATLAICLWPAVAIALYRMLPLGLATLWTILGAQLLLPVGTSIKFAMIPAFDKTSVPNFCALLGCLLAARQRPKFVSSFGLAELLVFMYLIGPFITSELNGDPIVVGDLVLPGVGVYDAFSALEAAFITLLPFFLGRRYLRSSGDNLAILNVLVVAGLAYSIPMFFEIRFSPQLHYWLYGYYPSEFLQGMRDGGFRPMVFMGHGLIAAFFTMTTVVAAAALWRLRVRLAGFSHGLVTSYLGVLLVFCKTASASLYGIFLVSLVSFAKPRLQIRIASLLVFVALLYPMLRSLELVPTKAIVELASSISSNRADSLKFRFDNEDRLLDRASQRIWFGWGRYGRSRVYAEWGQDVSVTDGRWVITLGTFGLFGFVAEFCLLSLCVFRSASALKVADSAKDRICLAALALIVGVNVFDLLPNSGLLPWTWLLSGALLGRAEAIAAQGSRGIRRANSGLLLHEPRRVAASL